FSRDWSSDGALPICPGGLPSAARRADQAEALRAGPWTRVPCRASPPSSPWWHYSGFAGGPTAATRSRISRRRRNCPSRTTPATAAPAATRRRTASTSSEAEHEQFLELVGHRTGGHQHRRRPVAAVRQPQGGGARPQR